MTLDWQLPYPSRRAPVFAENVVATSQPLATQAGLAVLRAGGNAVDAALASAITLTVVEPNNNGIGSDAFAILNDGDRLIGLNASGRAPMGLTPDRFTGMQKMPVLGWDAVTVPGAVSAWVALSERFGRLPFASLFTDAIRYAKEGYLLGPVTGASFHRAAEVFREFPAFMSTFMKDGEAPKIGDVIKLPDHARTLESIAESHGDDFYRGELARAIVADAAAHNAVMSLDDLELHRCDWVDPISMQWGETSLHEIPPNGQGLMALIALGVLRHLDIERYPLDSADSVHLQAEAIRIGYAEIAAHLSDLQTMKVAVADLLDESYLQQRAGEISLNASNRSPTTLGASPDTVYLTAADSDGMMVSMIQSNYRGFGSGIVVPGTGISLQNRGSGFVLEPGHPNQVGPGKRPYHTIIPGFVTENGRPRMSFGVMGGHMQAQGHVQMMVRLFTFGQNPQAASDAPRWQVSETGQLLLEQGFDPVTASELSNRGHEVSTDQPPALFGGAQLIYRLARGYCAGSDHRKEGLAAGF